MKYDTPSYIKALVVPSPQKSRSRRVWSIDLENVWLPFFTATNTMGDTAIPAEALGCPLRLGYDKDGAVKFSQNGRPVIRVAKPISEAVAMVRENFVAHLQDYTENVATAKEKEYGSMVNACVKAGKPIAEHDSQALNEAIQARMEAQLEAEAEAEAEATPEPDREKELVTA